MVFLWTSMGELNFFMRKFEVSRINKRIFTCTWLIWMQPLWLQVRRCWTKASGSKSFFFVDTMYWIHVFPHPDAWREVGLALNSDIECRRSQDLETFPDIVEFIDRMYLFLVLMYHNSPFHSLVIVTLKILMAE